MKIVPLLDDAISQAEFATMVGVSEARVSQLMAEQVIQRGDTAHGWLLGYCERLRDMAAGRGAGSGGLDLVQERAQLARSQRTAQDIKNAVAVGTYAPIALLSDVLGMAASGVVDRFDMLEGAMHKACPDLPEEAKVTIGQVIASARNEWIRSTESLVAKRLEEAAQQAADEAEDAIDDSALPDGRDFE